jgi:plastocyanin
MRSGTTPCILGMLVLVILAGSARAEVIQVRIENIAFAPRQVSAHVGDSIEWNNADIVAHTATARNGAWDVTMLPNATARVVLTGSGSVDYYCRFHPNMTGQIVVAE